MSSLWMKYLKLTEIRLGSYLIKDGLRSIFRQRAQCAGLGLISPHDVRRTFATLSLRNGAPTRILQKAGRWKRIQTVELYPRTIQPQDFAPYFPTTAIFEKRRKSLSKLIFQFNISVRKR